MRTLVCLLTVGLLALSGTALAAGKAPTAKAATPKPKPASLAADPVNQPLAIPKKYQHAEQSGLTADVQKGSNVFDFDIPEM